MEVHETVGKWRQTCSRKCRAALWSAMLLGVLAVLACQGNGETQDASESLSGDTATVVSSGEASETPSGDSGTAEPFGEASGTELPSGADAETSSGDSGTAVPSGESGGPVDRITFVNATGELFTIAPNGDDRRPLTSGVQAGVGSAGSVLAQPLDLTTYYAWPTWSPGGTKIAASRVRAGEGGAQISLEIIDAESARTQTVYNNQVASEIARGAPHYLYWSPDDRYLAFLAVAPSGQTLFVLDTLSQEKTAALAVGSPIYFHWSSDSGSLLIHDEREINLAREPFDQEPQWLVTTIGDFRPPAFSLDGQLFAYVDIGDVGASLLVTPVSDPEQGRSILAVGPRAAFAWSPNGRELAIADQPDPRAATFQRLRIVPIDGGQARTIDEDLILAFYWSPQGDKIAWVVLDLESRAFEWKVSASSGGPAKQLFQFQPSSHFFTTLAFFDQYAYSHSPWSPDGKHLVVSGVAEETLGRGNGTAPTEDRVFVLDATGAEAPRNIAAGVLAFWSWN